MVKNTAVEKGSVVFFLKKWRRYIWMIKDSGVVAITASPILNLIFREALDIGPVRELCLSIHAQSKLTGRKRQGRSLTSLFVA